MEQQELLLLLQVVSEAVLVFLILYHEDKQPVLPVHILNMQHQELFCRVKMLFYGQLHREEELILMENTVPMILNSFEDVLHIAVLLPSLESF